MVTPRRHTRMRDGLFTVSATGTLAEAGVLASRPAAVHRQLADEFARRFPTLDVRPGVHAGLNPSAYRARFRNRVDPATVTPSQR